MAGTDAVLTRLREEILRGTYAPNQRLIEADLADRLGASRFVLRNCLIQLAAEGLVELQPNRGARVRETTAEEAVEITELRQSIEALVAGRAAERVTDAQVAELRVDDLSHLRAYLAAVVERTGDYVRGLSDEDLTEVIDSSWDPPVTRGTRLISVVDDATQHLGQAAYARTLVQGGWSIGY